MAANDARGEVSLTLDGEDFALRPTWEALKAIGSAIGRGGTAHLAELAFTGQLRDDEVALIAAELIRAWGRALPQDDKRGAVARNVDTDRIGELIMGSEIGFAGTLGVVAVTLSLAATGGYTPSGERKPAAKKKATPTAG